MIHSIELDEALHRAACENFAGNGQVRLHCGSSPDVLRRVIVPQAGTVFWLDAHYSGGLWSNTVDPLYGECPLLYELQAIRSFLWDDPPLIIVDDADHFNPIWPGWGAYDRAQWPTIDEIAATVAPWPVWVYGIDAQSANDDCQLIVGRTKEELGG